MTNAKCHAFIQIRNILKDIFDFPLFEDVNFDPVKLPSRSRPYLTFITYRKLIGGEKRGSTWWAFYFSRFTGRSRCVRSQFYYFLQISIALSRGQSFNLFTFM